MQVISVASSIYIIVSATEAEMMISGIRALNDRHEHDRTMTPHLKDAIIIAIMQIEGGIASVNEIPELPQIMYDSQSQQ